MNALSQHPDALNADPTGIRMDTPSPVTLIKHDLRKGLPYFSKKLQSPPGFDLIFLDPPYSLGLAIQLLQAIDMSSLLRQHTLLIVEERAKETLPERLTRLTLVDQRKYGEAGFWFYQPLLDQTT